MEADKVKARAKNNAYMLLRSRPRSELEITTRLRLKGYGDEVVAGVVADLKRTGDIDDEKFARFWIESRMHSNPVGDVVLRHELKQKGVADPIIEATLEEKAANYDEYGVAFSMADERFERLKKLDRRKATKRLYDFLLRRGFKFDTVQKVIEKIINEDR